MLVIISPAKTLDYITPSAITDYSLPMFVSDSAELIDQLKQLNPQEISNLMKISEKLANINFSRYLSWNSESTLDNAKQAVLAFKGDVYSGLDVESLSSKELNWAQNHVRILSGLYGLLRPLDLMQPYRLEMGTNFKTNRGKDLYEFWGNKITSKLNQTLHKDNYDVIINLASKEYFKAIKSASLEARIVTPVFKDWKNDKYKIISFFAKKARGMMSRYIIQRKIQDPEEIKLFDTGGYKFDSSESTKNEWIFTRKMME
jgi:cytoplasmic iron level regulating protein YaaA (DUF328/UPF0246 family)